MYMTLQNKNTKYNTKITESLRRIIIVTIIIQYSKIAKYKIIQSKVLLHYRELPKIKQLKFRSW